MLPGRAGRYAVSRASAAGGPSLIEVHNDHMVAFSLHPLRADRHPERDVLVGEEGMRLLPSVLASLIVPLLVLVQ